MEKMDMLSMTLEEWESIIKQWKQPSFRAKQIFDWLHSKHITEIDDMTNIPKDLREKLKQYYPEPDIPKEEMRKIMAKQKAEKKNGNNL